MPPDAGPRGPRRVRHTAHEPAREPRPVLGPRRRPGAGPAQSGAAAAGGPVESLPGRAGDVARRRGRSPGEGTDRAGLRGPLLLGHRDLRPAVPDLHPAEDRPEPAAVPAQHAGPRAGAGGRDEPARGALPVADDQRRGGFVQFPAGHRPVSHQRRYRLRDHALHSSVEGSGRVLGEIGAEILVETARLWADLGFYGADEEVPHPRRDRARRVHHRGQRQRLHQPHGAAESQFRRRHRPPPARGAAGGLHRACARGQASAQRGRVLGARGGRHARAVR